MSFKPMIWAWEVDGLTQPTKLVLMSLANHANDHGVSCHPSVERIAKEAVMSVRSVQYALKWLEKEGYIKVYPRARDTHQFRLLMNLRVEAARVQDLHPSDDARVQNVQSRVQNTSFEGAGSAPKPRIEPRIEPRRLFADDDDEKSLPEMAAAPSPTKAKADADSLLAIWNLHCSGLRKLTSINDARRRLMLKQFKNEFGSDLAEWESFCERVGKSDFLKGKNDRGWRLPTFEWLMRSEKINNVREGVYDNRAEDARAGRRFFPDGAEIAPGTI